MYRIKRELLFPIEIIPYFQKKFCIKNSWATLLAKSGPFSSVIADRSAVRCHRADLDHLDDVDARFAGRHLHDGPVVVLGCELQGGENLVVVRVGHFQPVVGPTTKAGDVVRRNHRVGCVRVGEEVEGDVTVLLNPPVADVAVVGGSRSREGCSQHGGSDEGRDETFHDWFPFVSVENGLNFFPESGALLRVATRDES